MSSAREGSREGARQAARAMLDLSGPDKRSESEGAGGSSVRSRPSALRQADKFVTEWSYGYCDDEAEAPLGNKRKPQ
jgi:hypothetical protein